jgi:hypothetical protein
MVFLPALFVARIAPGAIREISGFRSSPLRSFDGHAGKAAEALVKAAALNPGYEAGV